MKVKVKVKYIPIAQVEELVNQALESAQADQERLLRENESLRDELAATREDYNIVKDALESMIAQYEQLKDNQNIPQTSLWQLLQDTGLIIELATLPTNTQ